jgi:hypothetical protein
VAAVAAVAVLVEGAADGAAFGPHLMLGLCCRCFGVARWRMA